MKNVLIDCERLKYPNTGLHTFCTELAQALLKNKATEIDYTFYVPKNKEAVFGSNTSYKKHHPLHKIYIPKTTDFDVWHTTYQGSRYKPYNSNTKIIYTIHDLNFLIEKKDHPSKIKTYLQKIQRDINRAEVITCISEYVKTDVLKHLNLNGKEIHVIYNGVHVSEFPEFNQPNYLPNKPFLFSIGTVLPKKNFHVLPCLLVNTDYELIIAGNHSSPAYIEQIKAEAQKHNVLDRVHIIGSITDAEKYWYYKNCKAFVFPSIAEGFGLPAIEAMYFQKPVFLSNHTSLPEIGGDVAFYYESFEANDMQQTLANGISVYDSKSSHEYIKNHAEKFTWEKAAHAYQNIYLRL